jgi:lipopolysaccharide transport system ATP-binding protein
VASLLEVGTGFHPELSGRENIYLNGAILGMGRAEIRAKFDAIVAFAEVEKFLDTPVKRYSSGMYMRLAFAVAAHLEPEILIVDEVLAVGDVEFQRKCLGRMQEIGGEGRTVIFVSHNMSAISSLCSRCLLLRGGRLVRDSADIESVVRDYLGGGEAPLEWVAGDARAPHREFIPKRLRLRGADGATLLGSVRAGSGIFVELEGEVGVMDPAFTVGYALFDEEGRQVYWSYQTDQVEEAWPRLHAGRVILASPLPDWLNEGRYRLELIASLHFRQWLYEPGSSSVAITFEAEGHVGDQMLWRTRRPTHVAPVLPWTLIDEGR